VGDKLGNWQLELLPQVGDQLGDLRITTRNAECSANVARAIGNRMQIVMLGIEYSPIFASMVNGEGLLETSRANHYSPVHPARARKL
jgi:hypothetical protein